MKGGREGLGSYHRIIIVCMSAIIASLLLLAYCYVTLRFWFLYNEFHDKKFLKIGLYRDIRVKVVFMDVVYSQIGVLFTEVLDRHPEYPVILIGPVALLF